MVNRAFATVLRGLREKQGFSQEQFGYRAGLHRTYVSQLERGLKSPSLNTLSKIAPILGISLSKFVALVEEELKRLPAESP